MAASAGKGPRRRRRWWSILAAVDGLPGRLLDGVLKSTDGGATSTQLDGYRVNEVLALALDPAHPETLYVGGGSGQVAKSTDGGATWFSLPQFLGGDIQALAVDPVNSQVVYAGLTSVGLWKSVDGGASWAAQTTSAFGLLDVGSIATRPAASQNLLIGTGAGVPEQRRGGELGSLRRRNESRLHHRCGVADGFSGHALRVDLWRPHLAEHRRWLDLGTTQREPGRDELRRPRTCAGRSHDDLHRV